MPKGHIAVWPGRLVDPFDIRPGDVDIWTIAHSLSQQCRYTGHTWKHYCPTEDQKVLTTDLRWVPAGDLKAGDDLLGFDEYPHELGAAATRRRRFRPSKITFASRTKTRLARLELSDGSTVRSSLEHPWLVATKQSRNQCWQRTVEIADAVRQGRKRYMHKFLDPWSFSGSWKAGWLAGMFDGEGSLSFKNCRGFQATIAQNPGPTTDQLVASLASFGFKANASPKSSTSRVINRQIRGGFPEILRLLGQIRPERLVGKFVEGLNNGSLNKQLDGKQDPLEIVAAWDEGEGWVAGLETSTRTYLCEGYGAHNSTAEHCVLLSKVVPTHLARVALMHEAAEVVVTDLSYPVKTRIPGWQEMEDGILYRILDGFFDEGHVELRRLMAELAPYDRRICVDEMEKLLILPEGYDPRLEIGEPLGVEIHGWSSLVARQKFYNRYMELFS